MWCELNRQGVTIVLTTHYLEEAEELCDTIAIVNHGQVVACEPTGELLRTLDTPHRGDHARRARWPRAPDLGRFQGKLAADGRLAVDFKTSEAGVETGAERRARRRRGHQGPANRGAGPGGRVPGPHLRRRTAPA